MNNKLLDRLFTIYRFKNKNIDKLYYRDSRIKQLALYLHKASWDDQLVDEALWCIKYIDQLGYREFSVLCDMAALGQLDQFKEFIEKVIKVRV